MSHRLSQILKLISCFTEQSRDVHLRSPGPRCQSWGQRMEQFLEKRSSFNILKKGACCAKPPSPFSGSQQTQTQSMGAWHQHRLLSPEKTCGLFCSGNTNFGKKQKQNTSQSWARVGRFTTARQHLAQKKSWTQFLSDSDKFNPLPRHGPLPLPPKKANKCTPLDLSWVFLILSTNQKKTEM